MPRRTPAGLLVRLAAAILVAALAGTLGAQSAPTQPEPVRLGTGDVLRVTIWREPDLSGDFQVDVRGQVTLPLLGTRTVNEIPWREMRDSLMAAYRRELNAPAITLVPLRRVYILGEVARPGQYLADPTLSLGAAVALAGGATQIGDIGRLRVVRGGETIIRDASIESQLMRAGVLSDDQVFVGRRSWFERNSTFVASAVISLTGIIVTIVTR